MVCASAPAGAVPRVLELGGDVNRADLLDWAEVLEDPTGQLDFEQVRSASGFRQRPTDQQVVGYSDSAWWLWLRVRSVGETDWRIHLTYPLLDSVEVWTPDRAGGWSDTRVGDHEPHGEWPLPTYFSAIPVGHAPGVTDVYVRVASKSPVKLSGEVLSRAASESTLVTHAAWLWTMVGLLVGLLLYNLLLWATVRDHSYLYYVLYLGCAGLFIVIHSGIAFRHLWPEATDWNDRSLLFFGFGTGLFAATFARSFLDTPRHAPRFDGLLKVMAGLCVPGLLVCAVSYQPALLMPGAFVLAFLMVALLGAGIAALRDGYRPARLYVLAWGVVPITLTAGVLQSSGLLPRNLFTDFGWQAAVPLEALLLSIALADRINHMRGALQLLNGELEQRVRDRTAHLEREVAERLRTEQRKRELEEQLQQSQKMEAIGRLAGGVAHDMNNVLTSVNGFAALLQVELPLDSPHHQDVEGILEAANRGKALTDNLLGFARKGPAVRRRLDLHEVVDEAEHLLQRTVPRGIRVVQKRAAVRSDVQGDSALLSQALINLCLNAVDAMGDVGILTLETLEVDALADGTPGPWIALRVIDDGPGMDDETLRRALEPFFTSKPPGKGTGLGLPMVYGTVENHGGRLVLDSTPGVGTVATVYLPHAPVSAAIRARTGPVSGGPVDATILVVDDEAAVRAVAARMLRGLGADTIEADGGESALALLDAHPDIDAVMLDLIMPGMSGAQTFDTLRERRPDLPVLLCSGFSQEGEAEALLDRGARAFLRKPYGLVPLRQAIGETLGEGPLEAPAVAGASCDSGSYPRVFGGQGAVQPKVSASSRSIA